MNTATTPKTVSVTVQTGDLLIVMSVAAGANGGAVNTAPTGGSLTYAQLATLGTSTSHARAIAWSATAISSTTFSVSCVHPTTASSGIFWGVFVWVWRGHGGVGAVGAPTVNSTSNSVTLTTTGDNSALSVGSADWNAADGTTRTRRTVNSLTGAEDLYGRDSAQYTWYASRYADTGTAGSKTAGYSAPTGQASAIIAVEILGATGGTTTVTKSLSQTWNVNANVVKSLNETWNVNAFVVKSLNETWNVNALITKSLNETWVIRTAVVKSLNETWNVNALVIKSLNETWGIGGFVTKNYANDWKINALLTKSFDQTWLVSQFITKMLQVTWPISAFVIKSLNETWGIAGVVIKSYNNTWNINATLTKSYVTSWNINISVVKSYNNTWNVSAFVIKSLNETWQVGSGNIVITKSINFTWAVASNLTGSIADQEYARLTALGYTGTVLEMRRKWFLDQIVVPNEDLYSTQELEFMYLRSLGLTGSLADMRQQHGDIDFD